MLTFGITVLSYLAIGWGVAIWDMSRLFARLRERVYEDPYDMRRKSFVHPDESEVRVQARWYAISTMTLWPIRLPWLLMVRSTDKRDVVRIAHELDQREKHIEELERRYLNG